MDPRTDGFGKWDDLGAVEGEAAEGPDDGMNALLQVEGDGDDAAAVLPHRHPTTRQNETHSTWGEYQHGNKRTDHRAVLQPRTLIMNQQIHSDEK